MSSHPEVIRVYAGIDIDSDLIDAARGECDGLDLNTTDSFKVFRPGEKCAKIIDSLKNKISRTATGRTVFVLLPGATSKYMEATCIAVPIKKEGLPTSVITETGQIVTVNWEEGKAWEIRQSVKPAAVDKKGGTLLLWHLK